MKLQNWSDKQEAAFQRWLEIYKELNRPVPKLLVRPFRKGFRDRSYSPQQILAHRGLLPCE